MRALLGHAANGARQTGIIDTAAAKAFPRDPGAESAIPRSGEEPRPGAQVLINSLRATSFHRIGDLPEALRVKVAGDPSVQVERMLLESFALAHP